MQVRQSQRCLLDDLRQSLGDLKPTPLSHQRFDQSHEWFEGQSNQQRQILDWLRRVGSAKMDARKTDTLRNEDVFRVLSVGCGSGILDRPLIATLASQPGRSGAVAGDENQEIHYTGIDPNPIACQRFRDEFEQLHLDSVSLSVMEETVESYTAAGAFDLTHVVHALYYFDDPAASLRALMDRVADEGELVIFQAPKAELNLLADCFWQEHANAPIWFSGQLEAHLTSAGIVFDQQRIDAEVDVTACFQAGCPGGNLTLDFLVQSDCESLPTEARAGVLAYLKTISRTDEDRVLAPHPVDVFTLTSG